ncbi:MAG TPA: hypothetical protein VFN75_11455 [Pseudonocardiaceae bacterium]|nr:hypothetical protein [Pseudonocardiaceae bacterium]
MSTPAQRLAQEATAAEEVRAWTTHPDVVALQVEKTRTRVDRLMWAAIVLGLAFTMVNVQQFAARTAGVDPDSLGWWTAWLIDPTIACALLGILIVERRVAPGQLQLTP